MRLDLEAVEVEKSRSISSNSINRGGPIQDFGFRYFCNHNMVAPKAFLDFIDDHGKELIDRLKEAVAIPR